MQIEVQIEVQTLGTDTRQYIGMSVQIGGSTYISTTEVHLFFNLFVNEIIMIEDRGFQRSDILQFRRRRKFLRKGSQLRIIPHNPMKF